MVKFVEYTEADELRQVWPIVRQLRPHLTEETFLARVAAARTEGYRLYVAEDDGVPKGAIGWRVVNDLASGKSLYVDDLVVDEAARSRSYGRSLIAFAKDQAAAHGCATIRLTSHVHRTRAHAFYEREGFDRPGYSFKLALAD